jgi:hypothetical protein
MLDFGLDDQEDSLASRVQGRAILRPPADIFEKLSTSPCKGALFYGPRAKALAAGEGEHHQRSINQLGMLSLF